MSYNDKKFGNLFPTRTGTPIGGANERQMLDQVGGSEGYRKNFRTEPDGTVTMLTTKNGQPQFQTLVDGNSTDDSKNKAGLASGAVFVKTNGETYYTRTTAVAGYAAPGAEVKLVDRIDKTMTGKQPADKSATTAFVGTEPNIIRRCPSSLFTGKMRLYVQSLYGSLDDLPAQLLLIDTGMTMPALIYNGVVLDTSCGIYLNVATAKHYLLSVTTGNAHELIRAPGVRWLEKKLLDVSVSSADKAKIEAYLLAQSYPSPPQGMDLPPRVAGGMGYGWHFNWAGTAADCVGLESATNPGDSQACYKTTHWRITFSMTDGYVNGSLEKISEGLWRNRRHFRNICVPIWDMSGFGKLGFKTLPEFGSGPLYAYYSHDTTSFPGSSQLQLCTWTANMGEYTERNGIMWPDYMNTETLMVCGEDACGYETWPAHETNTFTITAGSASVSGVSYNQGRTVASSSGATSESPTAIGDYSWYQAGLTGPVGSTPPYTTDNGRPSPIPGGTTPQAWYWQPGAAPRNVGEGGGTYAQVVGTSISNLYWFGCVLPLNATWTNEAYGKNVIKEAYLIGFPPYYDAEAFYLWSRQVQTDTETGMSYACSGAGFRYMTALGGDGGPPFSIIGLVDKYWAPLTSSGTGTSFLREVFTYEDPVERIVCGAVEIVPPTPLSYSQFLSGSHETAEVFADLKSSTRGALYSATFSINTGNAPLTFGGGWSTYTGWA